MRRYYNKERICFNGLSVLLCFLLFLIISNRLFLAKTQPLNNNQNITWGPDFLISDEESDLAVTTKKGYAIQIDGDTVHVVWSSVLNQSNSEIYYRKSTDKGDSWSSSIRLTNADGSSMVPVLAYCQSNVYVVWKDNRDDTEAEIYFKSSSNYGADWGPDTRLTQTPDGSNAPAIDVYKKNIYVVWEEKSDNPTTCKAYFRCSQDWGANWDNPVLISEDIPKQEDGAPSITVGAGNIIHVVFGSDRNAGETAGYNWENYYTRSTDKGASWLAPVRLTNDTTGDTRFPVVATFGSKVHVAWWDDRVDTTYTHYGYPPARPEEYKNYEIFYKRSLNNGLTWQEDFRLTHADRISKSPSIIAQGDTVVVVWMDNRDNNYEIYLKYSIDGGTTWSEDIRATDDPYFSKSPSIAMDSLGTIYLLWSDNRTGKYEAYFKKSDSIITGFHKKHKENTNLTFSLKYNYPNPFNSVTTIIYEVSSRAQVQLVVFNLLGEEVARLINGESMPGTHEVQWDAKDLTGCDLPSGIYICKLTVGTTAQTRKLLLVR